MATKKKNRAKYLKSRRDQRAARRKQAVSSVTLGRTRVPEISRVRPSFEKDTIYDMNDTLMQMYWSQARLLLVNFRATNNCSMSADEKAAALKTLAANLESSARSTDPNRRTSPYNLPSLYQDQMTALASKTVFLATKWLSDGCPAVPAI